MPETPSKAALVAARAAGYGPGVARLLDAYAAERMAQRDPTYDQLRAERDAALARTEAERELRRLMEEERNDALKRAEAAEATLRSERETVADLLHEGEERVRVLGATLLRIRDECGDVSRKAARLAGDALAKAAAAPSEGGKDALR